MKTDFKKNKASLIVIVGIVIIAAAFIVPHLSGSKYLRAAKAGGDYLVNHMYEDGSFVYEYDPIEQKESNSYNILRHAGTAYSLLELYDATQNKKYLEVAERALVYLNDQIIPCPGIANASCVEENDEIKLGGNALAILAFAEHAQLTGSTEYLAQAQSLARFMTTTQEVNGEFAVHKIDGSDGSVDDFESGYYPGEAIFALTKLYEVDANPAWIDSAHKGAHWLIEVRDADVATEDLNHDHWLLYGLNELYMNRPDEAYLTHARRITDSIVALQHNGQTGEKADWNGGYYTPPRSTPTATRSEGLGAAYFIFTRAGDETYTATAQDVMEKGLEFQLRTQFSGRQLAKLSGDTKATGGFHESLDEYTIRIDYVQHNISALLAFDRIENAE